ncbi:hypothetical protein Glove_212g139 [Diversispora epigaea]|uniref:Crinkler effector protein N-terminal domain-containing protein n=1 Tax=Diversispora epigaea TaxID=1348612 RepID=A0A397IIA1_9GLOM|nr:hypothetical protein Glove_212g139 [Diversispora epigaea]
MEVITLNCLVEGDDPYENCFVIKINKTESVSILKKHIKNEKKPNFDHLPADQLKLWKVNIFLSELNEKLNILINRNLAVIEQRLEGRKLLASDDVQDYFNEQPTKKHMHIIVECPHAGPRGVVEFWKKLLDAKIVFPIPRDMEEVELNGLKSYSTIKNSYVYLNKGVITDSDGILYNNGEITNIRLPSKLVNNFGGILCLPDGIFFLGEEHKYGSKLFIRNCYLQLLESIEKDRKLGLSAHTGCAITGVPGIGKTYFGLYLLFYIHYKYPKATIIWRGDENKSYQFSPDGNVQKEDINLFDKMLENPDNFYIANAHTMTWYSAYKILLTSSKVERFDKALKWPGFTHYCMPTWELKEITTFWTLLYKDKINNNGKKFTFELFETLLKKWGPIPRSVLLKWNDIAYQANYFDPFDVLQRYS